LSRIWLHLYYHTVCRVNLPTVLRKVWNIYVIINFISVGSFIASYLRNLRSSANPSKEKIKAVFGEVRTTKKFPVDFQKFSNNFEFSYLLGGLNIGSTVESNIIYSQRSYLPRASSLNLTTELFGHSVNFLEVCMSKMNKVS